MTHPVYAAAAIALSFLSLGACSSNEFAPDEFPENEATDAIVVSTAEVARIQLEHGEVVYTVDTDGPMAGELTVLETSSPDKTGVLRLPNADQSPLERYLALTGAAVPIPRSIVDSERDPAVLAKAASRRVVERLEAPVDALSNDRLAQATNAQMCAEGTTSPSFLSQVCSANDHFTKNFCHNGTWYSVTDATGNTHKAEWSRSLTLACGANGKARHDYKFGGIWYKTIDGTVPSGQLYQFTRKGGAKLQRRIKHSRTASGFVRGSSHFFRFPF